MYKEETKLDENGFVVGKVKMEFAKLKGKTNFECTDIKRMMR